MTWKIVVSLGGTVTNTADIVTPASFYGRYGVTKVYYDTNILLAGGSSTFLTNTGVISNAAGPAFANTGFGVASYSGGTGNRLLNTGAISGSIDAVRSVSTVDNAGTLTGAVVGTDLVRNGYGDTTLARINGSVIASSSITNLGTILGVANVTISGSGITNGSPTSHAALIRGPAGASFAVKTGGIVLNYGTVENPNTVFGGQYAAVDGYSGSNVTNASSGVIQGATGVNVDGDGVAGKPFTLANDGSIAGTVASAVRLSGTGASTASAGSIVNGLANTTALMAGAKYGVLVQVSDIKIDNRATIAGTGASGAGIADNTRSFVTNATSGTITGTRYGLLHPSNAAGTLANAGLVTATGSIGVGVSVFLNGGSAIETITNTGSIIAIGGTAAYGVRLAGSLDNSGLIEGMANGVHTQGATITNSGIIRGDAVGSYGVLVNSVTTIHNLASGTIQGAGAGIHVEGSNVSIDNAGLITGAIGISANFTTTTKLVNSGTIVGTSGTAVAATSPLDLTLLPGYAFIGTVVAPTAPSYGAALHLSSATSIGTITGLGTEFRNFKFLGVDAGATWRMVGDNTIPNAFSNSYAQISGTLQLAGNLSGPNAIKIQDGGTITGHGTIGGSISPTGLLEASGGTLVLAGRVAAGTAINIAAGATAEATAAFAGFYQHDAFAFSGPNATLIVDTPTNFTNKLTHLAQSDRVDLAGIGVASAAFVGSNLVVHRSGEPDLAFPVAAVDMVNPIALVAPDGSGGSMLTFAGDDTYFVNAPTDTFTEGVGWGTDTVIASINYVLPANVENLTLTGVAQKGWGNGLANVITGDGAANDLRGGGGDDTIYGGGGNDSLNGGAGNDTLTGGAGDDTMTGGPGVDRFVVDAGSDTITDLGRGGPDIVQVSAGASVRATLAQSWIGGAASSNDGSATIFAAGFNANVAATMGASGWTISNAGSSTGATLTGSAKPDSIIGGGGNDIIVGGGGGDILTGGGGADRFIFTVGTAGGATITDFVPGIDRIKFAGFGQPAGGASFVKLDATDWRVTPAGGGASEMIHFSNAPMITLRDYQFV